MGGLAGRGGAATGGAASSAPHVTQKRIPAWLALPHCGHAAEVGCGARGTGAGATAAGGGGEGSLGAKLTAGASGRAFGA
jgi:hypothetical protein